MTPPRGEGEGGNHHYPGEPSPSAAIPRISTQHSVSRTIARMGLRDPRSHSLLPLHPVNKSHLQQAVVSPLLQLQTSMVTLTPSLARLHREDLIYVQGWPAAPARARLPPARRGTPNIQPWNHKGFTAELKMARFIVAFAEIQATLQEQRILSCDSKMIDMERHTTTVTSTPRPPLPHQQLPCPDNHRRGKSPLV